MLQLSQTQEVLGHLQLLQHLLQAPNRIIVSCCRRPHQRLARMATSKLREGQEARAVQTKPQILDNILPYIYIR